MFVTIDGPNGVGKSTLITKLKESLNNYNVYCTREPSDTDLGIRIRNNEENVRGLQYAKMISEDRKNHLQSIIIPKLGECDVVICDRYVVSSLALQVFDGVSIEHVWEINKDFLIPDLSIIIYASEWEIEKRLKTRKSLTYFEKNMSRSNEITFYKNAALFLLKKGYNIISLTSENNNDMVNNVNNISDIITKILVR